MTLLDFEGQKSRSPKTIKVVKASTPTLGHWSSSSSGKALLLRILTVVIVTQNWC